MGLSFSKNNSSNNSKPLTPEERTALYNAAMSKIGKLDIQYNAPTYSGAAFTAANPAQSASYTDAGAARTLTGGDYNRLENNLLASSLAPIERQRTLDRRETDQSMADRGIYTSLNAIRANNDLAERYAPVIQKAASDAAAQRYGLQSNELNALNSYALNRAGQANQFNLANTQQMNEGDIVRAQMANQFNTQDAAARNGFALNSANSQYEAQWKNPEFLAGLWNGTAGQVSSGKTSGFGFGALQ